MSDIAEELFGYRTEVKRLEAEIERLRAALQKVADLPTGGLEHHKGDTRQRARRIALAALKDTTP